jgi:hypothetical protein
MSDAYRIIPYQVRSAGTDVPPEEVQAAINSICTQITTDLNIIAAGESSNVNITGGTIANVSITNSTGVTQPRLDNSTLLATDAFVNQQLASSTASIPFPLTGGVYNQASRGTGVSFVILVSGGAIQSVVALVNGGTGYAVGDLLVVTSGNDDAVLRVTSVSGGVIQSGGLAIIYGGTGYTTGITASAIDVPPGQRQLFFTGVLTSNVTFIIQNGTFLTASRRVEINNNTTGAFTVTVFLSNGLGGTTGSGVVIPQGTNNSSALQIETDGMNDVWLAVTPLGIGAVAASGGSLTGGTINNTTIGATTPSTGAFTTLSASSGLNSTAVGNTTPSTGSFTTLSATGNLTPSQTNGIVGTTTNNNANAGSVGEFVSSTVTTAAITNSTVTNVTSISLTAGDWDLWGNIVTNPAGTTTQSFLQCGISTTTAAYPAAPGFSIFAGVTGGIAAGTQASLIAPNIRLSLSSTTTVFLVATVAYAASTLTIAGNISARRRR